MKRPSFKLKKIWLGYFFVKLSYMFFALLVFAKLTTLGDTDRYIAGPTFGSWLAIVNGTYMMDFLGHGFSLFLGEFFANLPFCILAFWGIYYAVSRLNFSQRQLFFLFVMLSLPSFGIWTSIASKEAVGVFFLGIIAGFIIDLIEERPIKNNLLILVAFYLCLIFKPQYLIGIFALLIYVFFAKRFELRGLGKLILLSLFFFCSFLSLYLFRYQINELSFVMPLHFSEDAASTRPNDIWVQDFDVFWHAPYGMWIGFIGPTMSEAASKTTHLMAWLESFFVLAVFFLGLFKVLLTVLKTSRLNIFFLSVFLTVVLWLLFVHYPFGALNPGSAIRYRANFYGFLVILAFYVYDKILGNFKHRSSKSI